MSIQVARLFSIYSKNLTLSFFSNLHYCKFVLSIQYVYERVILLYLRLCLKAGAKVQLFFNLASFFEKIFWLFFHIYSTNIFKNLHSPILSFRVGKDTNFTFYYPNLFLTFFKVFSIRLTLSLCMNFFLNAGAKVGIYFILARLSHSFFTLFFDTFLNSLITRI